MVKKFTFILILLAFAGVVLADNENGDTDKNKEEAKGVRIDSVSGDTIYIEIEQSDDTLVFEDWEGPGAPTINNDYIAPTSEDDEEYGEISNLNPDVEMESNVVDERKNGFDIYPNPVANELHIRAERVPDEVRVVSMSGETIYMSHSVTTIDVRDFKGGLYFIELVYNDHLETMKFIKTP